MMKSIKNRLGNALLMTFMATIGWFILGLAVTDFIGAIKLVGVMFLCLFIVFCIMLFNDENLDFLSKG